MGLHGASCIPYIAAFICSTQPIDDVTMKRLMILGCLVVCLGFSACQCSEKPDVGPVEGAVLEQAAAPRAIA